MKNFKTPKLSYGVIDRYSVESIEDECVEQVRNLGYGILDSGFTSKQLEMISLEFNRVRSIYIDKYGESRLKLAKEFHTIRAPIIYGGVFKDLIFNENLLSVLKKLISGKFILNQQNGIINPPQETYNQGAWHRDLPYQHYISSTPLAVNALFCVDDFTYQNGSTFVLPASHKAVHFPSQKYVENNALQIEAKAGQYIILDCMLYHSGGFNESQFDRRAVNHVYTTPYFKQQIKLSDIAKADSLSLDEQELLGFTFFEPTSIDQYLDIRLSKS